MWWLLFDRRRSFSRAEATRVTKAYAELHELHQQMVLDTCPIRAACQVDPTLKALDDWAASWTISVSGLYLQEATYTTLRCGLFTLGYIDLVMDQLIPFVEKHTKELREACAAEDTHANLNE